MSLYLIPVVVADKIVMFEVADKPAFEIELQHLAQCVTSGNSRNEVSVQVPKYECILDDVFCNASWRCSSGMVKVLREKRMYFVKFDSHFQRLKTKKWPRQMLRLVIMQGMLSCALFARFQAFRDDVMRRIEFKKSGSGKALVIFDTNQGVFLTPRYAAVE
jgi:hypothetical protein